MCECVSERELGQICRNIKVILEMHSIFYVFCHYSKIICLTSVRKKTSVTAEKSYVQGLLSALDVTLGVVQYDQCCCWLSSSYIAAAGGNIALPKCITTEQVFP